MKKLALFAISLGLAIILVAPYQASQAADCRFVLGFKAIYDLIPDKVGECLVNEHYNPENGDALQETTGGLLVWRKADNFTAFTNGYRSWVNGPFGLQQRLNTEQFEWEAILYGPRLSETEYTVELLKEMGIVKASVEKISRLLKIPFLDDPEWTGNVIIESKKWQSSYERIRRIRPPERYGLIHIKTLAFFESLNSAANDLQTGLTQMDGNRVRRAAAKMLEASAQYDGVIWAINFTGRYSR